MALQAVHTGGYLDEEALRVVAYVNGEPGPHSIVRGAAATFQVPRLEGQVGDVRVVQRMADFFEDEVSRCLEVQGTYPTGKTSADMRA